MSEVSAIPEGYEGITPYLAFKDANSAIEFYKKAFGAEELFRIDDGDRIGHAELKIGAAIFMLSEENPEYGALSPETVGGSPVSLMFYVPDVDRFTEKAVESGLKVIRPVQDQFYGDRSGFFEDPFGYKWSIATHIRDVSPEEMNEVAKNAGAE